MPIGTTKHSEIMCAHNISVMPHGSVQCDLFFLIYRCLLEPASSSNQGLLTIAILLEPSGICLMSFSLSVVLVALIFKVVVCFNAYT